MLDNQGYLKLKANDKNDLKVFAAYLQDSVIIPQDIKYLEKNKTLICVFNSEVLSLTFDSYSYIFWSIRAFRPSLVPTQMIPKLSDSNDST